MPKTTPVPGSLEAGDPARADEPLPGVYHELRQLAAARMAGERSDHTLQATALVHEAWIKLCKADGVPKKWNGQRHFFAAAVEAMRRILIDHARHKMADLIEKMVTAVRASLPAESPQLASQLARGGMSLLKADVFAEAETLLRECHEIRGKTDPGSWLTFSTQSMLGGALLGQEKFEEAAPLLVSGYEGITERADTIPPQGQPCLGKALER